MQTLQKAELLKYSKITNYYIEERYPILVESNITKDDLEGELKKTQELIKFILERCGRGL